MHNNTATYNVVYRYKHAVNFKEHPLLSESANKQNKFRKHFFALAS